MELLNSLLPIFNAVTLAVFMVLVVAAVGRMSYRYSRIRRLMPGTPTPVLLKRDIALFGALALFFGSALVARMLGAFELGMEAWWVLPRTIMVLVAMAYWVKVEYTLEDDA